MDVLTHHWNQMYAMNPEQIPWEIEEPPIDLTTFIDDRTITPCRTLDVGCGTGNYSIYLAKQGFGVTGIDPSERAIDIAKKKAKDNNVAIDFVCGTVADLPAFDLDPFEFIFEYSLLHHIPDEGLNDHINVYKTILKPGGKLLIVCYSDDDAAAHGQRMVVGKYGNAMYFRSAEEIRDAFKGFKEISYAKTILGKRGQHKAHRCLFSYKENE